MNQQADITSGPLTVGDVANIVAEAEQLFRDLMPKIDWQIITGAENNPTFDMKVRCETCWDNLSYANKHKGEWLR